MNIINIKEDVIIDINAKIDKLEKENKYIKDKNIEILSFKSKNKIFLEEGTVAILTIKMSEKDFITYRFYGNDILDNSFNSVDFSEKYFSPSSIRTISHILKEKALSSLKEEEVEAFNNTVWTHDQEMANEGLCPCKECVKK